MLEQEIRDAEADVQAADVRVEQALEAGPERSDLGNKVIAAAVAQAGARIALALLRGAQALAQNMGDPRR
jgi:Cdc6-like AAA superfamily ATPase